MLCVEHLTNDEWAVHDDLEVAVPPFHDCVSGAIAARHFGRLSEVGRDRGVPWSDQRVIQVDEFTGGGEWFGDDT